MQFEPFSSSSCRTSLCLVCLACISLQVDASESERHQSWKLREIDCCLHALRIRVLFGKARLLQGIHHKPGLEKGTKQLMQGPMEVNLHHVSNLPVTLDTSCKWFLPGEHFVRYRIEI